ncbi:MAG: FeoA family protein [Oribacterium sp.]|nr:FeoA family protein [Oribacterium sp.]MDY6307952.1 FeoA family protein [Oribacterium sp.]
MRSLRDVNPGEDCVVTKITGQGAVKRRIMDMGITKGTPLHVRKVAPLGDPVEITVRGYELSVRKEDAAMVEIEDK